MLILNIQLNEIFKTLKSNVTGLDNPNSFPYANHHNQSTLFASSPSNPPSTKPDNKNTNKIHKFFSFVEISVPPFFLTDIYIFTVTLYIDKHFFSSNLYSFFKYNLLWKSIHFLTFTFIFILV